MLKIVEFFSLSLLVFLPVAFTTLLYSSFGLTKIVVLRFFTMIVVLLYIIKYCFGDIREENERINKRVNIPFIFLLFVLLASSLVSISPILSFFGTYDRFDGYLSILNYIGVYFIFYLYLSEKKHYERFISFLIYSSIPIIFYGLLQSAGFDFIKWGIKNPDRIFSLLGHAIFLGTYLALIYPFALFRFFFSEKTAQKIFYFCYLILSYITLVFTLSRSAYLAWIIAIIIFFYFTDRKLIKKNIYKVIILFFSISILTYFFNAPSFSKNFSTVSERAVSTLKIKTDSSIKERWNIYIAALRIIRDYPLFGSGPETMKNIFTKYRDLRFIPVEEAHYIADKAHNEFLHIAATSGLFGLFSYLWMYLVIFFVLFYSVKKEEDHFKRQFLVCCLCSFFAFLVGVTFSFGVSTTYTFFYAIVGAGISIRRQENKSQFTKPINSFKKLIFFPLVFGLWMYLVIKFVVYPALADNYYLKAVLTSKENTEFSLKMIKKAQKLNPYESTYIRYSGKLYSYLSFKDKKYIISAIEAYNRYFTVQPFNAEAHYEVGRILLTIPAKDKNIFQYVLSFYEKAHSLYPEFIPYSLSLVDILIKYYSLYKEKQYLDKAYSLLVKINSKYPDIPSVWYYLGKYFYLKGDLSSSELWFEKTEKRLPNFCDCKIWLGNVYLERKKYKDAISKYELALKLSCEFPAGIYNQIGIAYRDLGDIKKAKESFEKALQLEPNYTGARKNLEDLNQKL